MQKSGRECFLMEKKITKSIWVILILLMIIPFFIPIFYLVPKADEYGAAASALRYIQTSGKSVVEYGFYSAFEGYMTWQGTWGAWFLGGIVSALGISVLIDRIITAVIVIAFIVSMLWVSNELRLFWGCRTPFFVFAVTFLGINSHIPSQAVYWIGASIMYLFAYSIALFSIALLLKYIRIKNESLLWLSSIFAFFSTSGVLLIAGFINVVLFFISIYAFNVFKRRYVCAPFVSGLTGAIINTLAPGNFVRNAAFAGNKESILRQLPLAIINSLKTVREQLYDLSGSTALFISIVFGIVVGLYYVEYSKRTNPLIISLVAGMMVLAAIFPVCLGYHAKVDGTYRVEYLISSIFLIALFVTIMSFTAFIKGVVHAKKPNNEKMAIGAAVILAILGIIVSIETDSEVKLTSVTIIQEWTGGELKEYRDFHIQLFDDIRAGKDYSYISSLNWPNIKTLNCDIMDQGNYNAISYVIDTMEY